MLQNSIYLDLLLASSGKEEVVHLRLQRVVHLDVNVVAGGLLVLSQPQLLHADAVIDHNWIWRVEQGVESLGYLGKLHPVALEYLLDEGVAGHVLPLVGVLQLVRLDVLPQRGDDDGSGLSVNTLKQDRH